MSSPTREAQILAYGQKAVSQGNRAAQRSPVAKRRGPQRPPAPQHVVKAQAMWKKHFSTRHHMSGVTFHDLAKAPSCLIAKSHFQAWTNSPNTVYVDASADGAPGMLYAVVDHEMEHIVAFRTQGRGKPPPDYVEMMRYERDAYGHSAQFAGNHSSADIRAFHATFTTMHTLFKTEITRVEKLTGDRTKQNAEYKRFLTKEQTPGDPTSVMLPAHQRLLDLYQKFTRCP